MPRLLNQDSNAAVEWLGRACGRFLQAREGAAPPLALDVGVDALQPLAPAHGLEPLLHGLVATGGIARETVPASLRERWLADYCRTTVANRRALSELERLLDSCRRQSVEILVFKGLAHVAGVYRDPGLRPMVDVDLLCRPAALAALERAFVEEGYEPVDWSIHHATFATKAGLLRFEVHQSLWDLIAEGGRFLDEVWRSQTVAEVDGFRFCVPSVEVSVVLDTAHALQHDLGQGLRQAVDLVGSLATPGLSVPRLDALLGETDLKPEFVRVAGLYRQFLGDGLFPEALAIPEPHLSDREFAQQRWSSLALDSGVRFLGELRARTGPAGKLRHLWRLLVRPTGLGGMGGMGGRKIRNLGRWRQHLANLAKRAWRKSLGRSRSRSALVGSWKAQVYRRRGHSGR